MSHPFLTLPVGDVDAGKVNTVIEIPRGSQLKVEWNYKVQAFELDRVESSLFAKPVNYGFIPQTLDEDGDELDTLVVCPEPLTTGVFLEARVIGIMKFIDDGEVDDKVVCVPADNRDNANRIETLEDLGDAWKTKITYHFTHYKDLKKPGMTEVTGWGDAEEAKKIIRECEERYKKERV